MAPSDQMISGAAEDLVIPFRPGRHMRSTALATSLALAVGFSP